jgi:aspartyl-tRNA(Asn)/glutamyl-tRNA(Gln) amidotransferase subunit A
MTTPALETIATARDAMRAGRLTAAALTEASLEAIRAHGTRTNAFITVHAESARAAARVADEEMRLGRDRGPLHGIPISLKDLIDEVGERTTAGSRVLDDGAAASDAPLVSRLREAGAIIIGRTNLHEFALGTTSEDSGFGPVRNPHDTSRVAGGSSGGSAAAVATGMGLASIGTDTGGSIRIPAAACGVVGLKPSRGEVPTEAIVPLSTTLDHAGPLALTVQDAAWIWQVLTGRPATSIAPAQLDGLRLTRLVEYFDVPLEPGVRAATAQALLRLEHAGVRVGEGRIDGTDRIGPTYADIVLPEAAHWHAPYLEARADRYRPTVHARILHGRTISAVTYLEGLAACARFAAQVSSLLESSDALVLPTLPITAPSLGETDLVVNPAVGTSVAVRAIMLKHTQLFNLSGHPAVSIPLASQGLPVGLQLVGRLGKTDRLLAIAAACEQVLGANAVARPA